MLSFTSETSWKVRRGTRFLITRKTVSRPINVPVCTAMGYHHSAHMELLYMNTFIKLIKLKPVWFEAFWSSSFYSFKILNNAAPIWRRSHWCKTGIFLYVVLRNEEFYTTYFSYTFQRWNIYNRSFTNINTNTWPTDIPIFNVAKV